MDLTIQQKLDIYKNLLIKWQKSVNLVSNSTLNEIETRHFQDSLQIVKIIKNKNFVVTDLGSGAGFPGMIIAINNFENVHLVESDQKKCVFLENVSRETFSSVQIHNDRIENINIKSDWVTSRALASVLKTFDWSEKLMKKETKYIFFKSKTIESELTEAKQIWYFDHEIIPSETDPASSILILSNIRKAYK